jgi:bromodomain-containing factor 1
MPDAPPPVKVSHERSEDPDEEPSAKRMKTESNDSVPEFAPIPSEAATNGNGEVKKEESKPKPSVEIEDDGPPTPYQVKEIAKALRSIKSTTEGRNFKGPVVELWPMIKDGYLAKVSNPIDLHTIEIKLKEGYASLSDYVRDIDLLHDNCVIFNGPEHEVTRAAVKVRDVLLSKLPPKEPAKPDKKKKTPQPAHVAQPVNRAPRTSHQALSPPAAVPSQTFALDPSGTPLIRRDSTKGDGGRPKREIHPPKSKDLIYSAPKKKKFAVELRFCEELLNEIQKPKYVMLSQIFAVPVDPVALGIPDYFKVIKNPMDLSTIREKLNTGQYENAKEFEADIRLMFRNCYKFNPPNTPVHTAGRDYESIFDAEWAKKSQYVAEHTVGSNAASPDSSAESADEESEEDEVEDTASSNAATMMQARLIEEQTRLISIMSDKNPNPVMVKVQQEMVEVLRSQLEELRKAAPAPKKKKVKPSKKAPPPKKDVKSKTKAYRPKHIGFAEKEQISNGIAQLEGKAMDQAIALLKKDLPELDLEQDPELDIDQFSNVTLSRLHDLIQKHAPHVIPAPEPKAPKAPKPQKMKKNKPMSKFEQEKKIEQLRQLENQFARQGSAGSDQGRGVIPCKYTPHSCANVIYHEYSLQTFGQIVLTSPLSSCGEEL